MAEGPAAKEADDPTSLLRQAAVDHRVPSLAAGVRRPDRSTWSAGVGHVDGRGGPAPSGDTQYRIGSITKSLTAALVLLARDDGRLDLDDPVGAHLDDVGEVLAGVRLVELLGHVGGVRAETSAPWWERSDGRSWDELADDLADEVVRPAPAGVLHYSNVGYGVLGRVLERVDGRSWAALLQDRLLGPLGMSRTSPAVLDEDHAVPLAVHPDRDDLLVEPAPDYGALAPAGQLWSTVTDLLRWSAALAGHARDVFAPGLVEEMARPRAVTTLDPPSAFGLGLQVHRLAGRTVVGHGGSVPGFVAGLAVDRDDGAAVVVLANSTIGYPPSLAADLFTAVVDAGGSGPADGVAAPGAPSSRSWPDGGDELVGRWYWGPRAVEVAVVEDELVVDLRLPTRRTRLEPRGRDRWLARDGYFTGESLRVVRGPDGAVQYLDLASFALTPRPYGPPASVPGRTGDGWLPRDLPHDAETTREGTARTDP